jgi:hypothetical protein
LAWEQEQTTEWREQGQQATQKEQQTMTQQQQQQQATPHEREHQPKEQEQELALASPEQETFRDESSTAQQTTDLGHHPPFSTRKLD